MDSVGHETSNMAQVIEHEMEHESGIAHHHSDNKSIHYDDSKESKKHLSDHLFLHHITAYDIGSSANSLPKFFIFPVSQVMVLASSSLFPSSISLKGLRRPPRVLG
jgi:hypothetical protein